MSNDGMSYKKAGVDIDTADATKKVMKASIDSDNPRILNSLGAFASLIDIDYPEIKRPVLVMKMEEPGSKQLLAAQHGKLESVGYDLVNHLLNDTIMMGARPIAVQDTIICGKLEKETVLALVNSMADACRLEGCDLVGGETSEQPRVIPEGSYILSAAAVGIVDREHIIDGSAISAGDVVLAVASNGVHTNGYTLIRSLLDQNPDLANSKVGDISFIEHVLRPHLCYNTPLQKLIMKSRPKGLAHVTGGGVVDNLKRILPNNIHAQVDLAKIKILPIFDAIKKAGNVSDEDMLRTYNMGVGMLVVSSPDMAAGICAHFQSYDCDCYQIGQIANGDGSVSLVGDLKY